MNHAEFLVAAKERYGDKITVAPVHVSDEQLEAAKARYGDTIVEDLAAYGEHAWVLHGRCPECDAELEWSFQWGMIHGEGYCRTCEKVWFRYYHYVRKGGPCFKGMALIGFPEAAK